MKFFFILISLATFSFVLLAEDATNMEIEISKSTSSGASCTKLLSALSVQKTLNFVFSENLERHENNITVSYKNILNEDRKLYLEMTGRTAELEIHIIKGLFKNLLLKLSYKQKKDCEINGVLSWKGEEKRYSKSLLVYIIGHYFDKLMSFLNRLT